MVECDDESITHLVVSRDVDMNDIPTPASSHVVHVVTGEVNNTNVSYTKYKYDLFCLDGDLYFSVVLGVNPA